MKNTEMDSRHKHSLKPPSGAELYKVMKKYILNEEQRKAHGYLFTTELEDGQKVVTRLRSSLRRSRAIVTKTQSSDDVQNRICNRCGRTFLISNKGVYLTYENCRYHWGKLAGGTAEEQDVYYSCCHGKPDAEGCETANWHVTSGAENENYENGKKYHQTKKLRGIPRSGNYGVYAIDCEMSYTSDGLDVTKVCVVGEEGVVYETFVQPKKPIVDFNTRFSGITYEQIYDNPEVQTISQVRRYLLKLISSETILIGHSLENDLRSLKILHENVIDIAFVFPHVSGLPRRRALKSVVKECLGKDIQTGEHDCSEDAFSCWDLMMWKVGYSSDYKRRHTGKQQKNSRPKNVVRFDKAHRNSSEKCYQGFSFSTYQIFQTGNWDYFFPPEQMQMFSCWDIVMWEVGYSSDYKTLYDGNAQQRNKRWHTLKQQKNSIPKEVVNNFPPQQKQMFLPRQIYPVLNFYYPVRLSHQDFFYGNSYVY